MALNDPFTLDLFSNTSLTSGLGLGVTAFPLRQSLNASSRQRHLPFPFRLRLSLRSPRRLQARISVSLATAASPRAGATAHRATSPPSASQPRSRPTIVRRPLRSRRSSSVSSASARPSSPTVFFGAWARMHSARVGRASVNSSRISSTHAPTHHSRATQYAHFTPEFIIRAV